jgi:hypothetical protein
MGSDARPIAAPAAAWYHPGLSVILFVIPAKAHVKKSIICFVIPRKRESIVEPHDIR